MDWKKLYLNWEGRISRSTMWKCWMGPIIAANIVIGWINISILSMIFSLATLFPGIVIGIKRIHDRNRSGWFLLIGLIPILNIWLLLELLAFKGTEGVNQYGADPLA